MIKKPLERFLPKRVSSSYLAVNYKKRRPSLLSGDVFGSIGRMKYFLLLGTFLLPVFAVAFSPIVSKVEQPYEIITVDFEPNASAYYLGELENYPVMYEVTSEESFVLSASLFQLKNNDEPIDFSLIAVRKNDRGGGVSEVKRQRFDSSTWVVEKDSKTGLTFWKSEEFINEVEAGTYRIEISTTKNQGKYLLKFGPGEDDEGYFSSLAGVRRTHQFFGYSVVTMFTSSLVYYPLGILFVLFSIERTWRYRKLIAKKSV